MSTALARDPGWRVWVVPGVVVALVAVVAGSLGWFLGQNQVSESQLPVEGSAAPGVERTRTDPLFSDPADLGTLTADTKAITFTVLCNGLSGAGWIIDTSAEALVRPKMRADYGSDYPQTVVTAEHVIRDFRKNNKPVRVRVGRTSVPAVLINWSRERAIATIGITSNSPAARPFALTPDGSWAMTSGAPLDDVLVPVIGQVVRDDGFDLLLHITTRPGNSGGPVFNSRGEVIGTIGGTILD